MGAPHYSVGLVGGVIGYTLGHLLGGYLTGTGTGLYPNVALSDSEDWPIVLGYVAAIIGWLAGLGVFNDILRQMAGRRRCRPRRTRSAAWPSTSGSPTTTRWWGSST